MGSVRGRITKRGGAPVPEATVLISGTGPFPDITPVSDRNGEFVLDGLAPGQYELRVAGPGGERGEAQFTIVRDATTPVEIIVDQFTDI